MNSRSIFTWLLQVYFVLGPTFLLFSHSALAGRPEFETENYKTELQKLVGFNYLQSNVYNPSGMWIGYDPFLVERELTNAEKAGINSVRIFLHHVAYHYNPEFFSQNVFHFTKTALAKKIKVMYVLFDSVGPYSSGDAMMDAIQPYWIGSAETHPLFIHENRGYLIDTIDAIKRGALGHDGVNKIFLDLWNEPVEEELLANNYSILNNLNQFVQSISPFPTTIGVAVPYVLEELHQAIPELDIVSYHNYSFFPEGLENMNNVAKKVARKHQVGLLASEGSFHGYHLPLRNYIHSMLQAKIGFIAWGQLVVGLDQFLYGGGYLYSQENVGNQVAVRDVDDMNAIKKARYATDPTFESRLINRQNTPESGHYLPFSQTPNSMTFQKSFNLILNWSEHYGVTYSRIIDYNTYRNYILLLYWAAVSLETLNIPSHDKVDEILSQIAMINVNAPQQAISITESQMLETAAMITEVLRINQVAKPVQNEKPEILFAKAKLKKISDGHQVEINLEVLVSDHDRLRDIKEVRAKVQGINQEFLLTPVYALTGDFQLQLTFQLRPQDNLSQIGKTVTITVVDFSEDKDQQVIVPQIVSSGIEEGEFRFGRPF
jgi:hypothetical protein